MAEMFMNKMKSVFVDSSLKLRLLPIFLCAALVVLVGVPVTLATQMDTSGGEAVEVTVDPSEDVTVKENAAKGEKTELTAAVDEADADKVASWQWQVLVDVDSELWVNISGETGKKVALTYGMVSSMVDSDGVARVRASAFDAEGNNIGTSDPVLVTIDREVEAVNDNMAEAAPASYSLRSSGIEAQAEGDDLENCTIVVNYIFENGRQAASPWTASIGKGTAYSQIVKSPTVVGYSPDKTEVLVGDGEEPITDGLTYTVTYSPAEVAFAVEHYQQNATGDGEDDYTLVATEAKTGYTESMVGDSLAKQYDGFYSLLYDTTMEIAADGSTVVRVYYDRFYYLMSFDLDGGYGVEPVYARFDAEIGDIGEPTKAGYAFAGWRAIVDGEPAEDLIASADLPKKMLAQNTAYKAEWTANQVTYDVVFWYENADDNGYSQAGVLNDQSALAGSTVNGSVFANANFTGRDAEHFTFSHADEDVTVKGDGSSVVNVYFSRNEYTLTFVGDLLKCGYQEHSHSHDECCTKSGWFHSCDTNKCPYGYEHSHGNSCYQNDANILIVTAKYDSDITKIWQEDPIKGMLDEGYVFESSVTGKYYSFLEKMPGQNITMTAEQWSGNTYTWYYYLEVLPGQSTDGLTIRTDNGKTYYEYDSTTVRGNNISLTYDEDYFPITGFTQRDSEVPSFSNRTAYLYYVRNSYDLTFSNNGDIVDGKGGSFLYQADISGQDFTPEYPSDLEAGAYVFEGWYTSPFYGDTRFEFSTVDEDGAVTKAAMPAKDITLYARWVPVDHKVNVYLTDDMDESLCEEQVVVHRELAEEPKEPTNGKYTFVGWFYMDGETEKSFDFSMPVTKDMDVYAKWTSNTLMEYTIRYATQDADGSLIHIADDTTGFALAGSTKTFEAKTGDELYDGYQSGYFPQTNSHTLEIDINNAENNVFTFVYIPKEELPYVVKYLEYGTGTALHEQKNAVTRDAVVTEAFVRIDKYMPDAYQKRLVLSADATQNEIIFWYTKDDVHAPVLVTHYIQNTEGDAYTVHSESTDLNGVIGTDYAVTRLNLLGFDYSHATANDVPVEANEKGEVVAEVSEDGLHIELYYDRELLPYEFRFLEQGTDKMLATATTGIARYESSVYESAKSIPGYDCVSADQQAIKIQIEDDPLVAEKNVRIFYYQEQQATFNYVVVPPEGVDAAKCGSLTKVSETVPVLTGATAGSTATAEPGYRFIGWYLDEACAQPAGSLVSGATLTPVKTGSPAMYVGDTYYAKFEYDTADLVITKAPADEQTKFEVGETFMFEIAGVAGTRTEGFSMTVVIDPSTSTSVTVKDLLIGDYVVTELADWSRSYTPKQNDVSVSLSATQENRVVFMNELTDDSWLDGHTIVKNLFTGVIASEGSN